MRSPTRILVVPFVVLGLVIVLASPSVYPGASRADTKPTPPPKPTQPGTPKPTVDPSATARPTAPPTPSPTPSKPTATPGAPTTPETPVSDPWGSAGASIEMYVHCLHPNVDWQELWTVVQWQDSLGNWHAVEGWRGGLDAVEENTGQKTWWVAERDFGTGPFRWVVYRSLDGSVLITSEVFHLPSSAEEVVIVDVSLQTEEK